MTEVWKPIPGFEGIYEASTEGRVRSVDRVLVDKNGVRKKRRGVVLSDGDTRGYRTVSLWRDGRQVRTFCVHQLVALAFYGPRPDGQEVRHLNGNAADNRLANLKYGTPSENQRDKVRHGTHHSANKTHCAQGHEFTVENTITDGRQRRCRTCTSTWARLRYQRRKAEVLKTRPDVDVPLTDEGAQS